MKKLYVLLVLFAPAISFAQWTTSGVNVFHNTTGLVGIGTSTATTFTNAKLNVYKTGNGTSVLIGNPNIASGSFTSLRLGTSADLNGYSFINSIKGAAATPVYGDLVLNQAGGNVGIGTTTPSAKLNVYQAGASTKLILGNSSTGSGGFTSLILGTSADQNGYTFLSSIKSSGTAMGDLVLSPDGGNVGIGKAPASNYKLDVQGTINATSILVGGQPISTGGSSQWVTTGSDIGFGTGNVAIGAGTLPLNGLNIFKSGDFNGGSIRYGFSGTNDGVMSLGFNAPTGRDAMKFSFFPHNSTSGQTDLMTLDVNGNIGIGTTTPSMKLHLVTSNSLDGLGLQHSNGSWANFFSPSMMGGAYNGITQPGDAGLIFGNNSGINTVPNGFVIAPHRSTVSGLRISKDGNVGIGTSYPDGFQVNSSLSSEASQSASNIRMGMLAGTPRLIFDSSGSTPFEIDNAGGQLRIFNPGDVKMVVNSNGSVGIGTTTPGSYYKLAVAGKIAAWEEIKVFNINSTFPDYVFDPSYKLPALEETEKYVKENHHLPEVPTAAEKAKDGMSLNEMNIILLKKVEELTLYVIEMKKENTEMKKEIKELKENQKK